MHALSTYSHVVLQLVLCLGREWTFLTRDRAFFLVNLIHDLVLGPRLGSINYHISIKAEEALGQWASKALYSSYSRSSPPRALHPWGKKE